MGNIVLDFYTGYEGEGEIRFIQSFDDEKSNLIRIWDGYFDDVMEKIEPEVTGWTALAYYYNLAQGWYDESPWRIPNLSEALEQFEQIRNSQFRFDKSKKVLGKICALLKSAIDNNNAVFIERE